MYPAKQRRALFRRDDSERGQQQEHEADEDGDARPEFLVDTSGGKAAGNGDDIEQDAEEADFHRRPAEHASGEGPAQNKNAIDAILIEHARNQKPQQHRAVSQFAQRDLQFPQSRADCGGKG